MKKNTIVFGCILCAFTLFSCQKEENAPKETIPAGTVDDGVPAAYSQLTLSAVSDGVKTTLDGNTVKWKTGDQIKVCCSDGSASDFSLVGEGGSSSGSFKGLVPSGETALYAVYPNDLYSSVSGATVNVTIPDTQDGVFGNANIAVAKIDAETGNMAFKNVNAFMGFTVPAGITKVVVSSVGASGNLSGTLAVDCSGEIPVAGSLSDGGASITATFPESTGGTYYVAVAPGISHTKGLLLEWYKGESVSGTYWLNKAITTEANNVYDMGSVSVEGDYYVTVDGAGSKSGMNWANAWSAAQLWAKLHPAGTDSDIDGAKLANIDGATFHLAAGTYNWGGSPSISINETATIGFTLKGGYNASTGERNIASNPTIFTGDDDADGTGDHRILFIDGNVSIEFNGITFTKGLTRGSGNNRFGGGVMIKAGSHSFVDCTFTQNSATTSGKNKGYGGAVRFEDGDGVLTLTRTTFSNNTATGDAGALSLSAGTIYITNGSFSNNSAPTGGAIDCSGASELTVADSEFLSNNASSDDGGAIAVEDNASSNISSTTFRNNSANRGGAICIVGGTGNVTLKRSYFYRNDAYTGGVVYTEGSANFFVDECSFEANWISGRIGCIFNVNGINKFSMYNSSAKDSYTKTTNEDYKKGVNPSWFSIDGVQDGGCMSFCNCSIIGDTWDGTNNVALTDGTALIVLWGSQTNYFTNCIIVPETDSSISAIRGDSGSEVIDLYYTHYSSVGNIGTNTDSGGNIANLIKTDYDGINWSNTYHCWRWNGTIDSDAPAMTTQANVYARVNTICPDFVTWSGSDFVKDQRGVSRGNGDWWPGAYQNN